MKKNITRVLLVLAILVLGIVLPACESSGDYGYSTTYVGYGYGYAGYGGGGIFNAGGFVTLTSSEISGSQAATGGGIHSSGEKYAGLRILR